MYSRFVVADIDTDSERALGVFHAVWNLRDAGELYAHEEEHDSTRWWFHENLEKPTRTERKSSDSNDPRRTHRRRPTIGIPHLDSLIHLFVGGSEIHGAKVKDTDDLDI
jgi:hypothetical protein